MPMRSLKRTCWLPLSHALSSLLPSPRSPAQVIAVSKLLRVYKLLRLENENILQLKGLTPNHKVSPKHPPFGAPSVVHCVPYLKSFGRRFAVFSLPFRVLCGFPSFPLSCSCRCCTCTTGTAGSAEQGLRRDSPGHCGL